jgi:hypothetical protein
MAATAEAQATLGVSETAAKTSGRLVGLRPRALLSAESESAPTASRTARDADLERYGQWAILGSNQ